MSLRRCMSSRPSRFAWLLVLLAAIPVLAGACGDPEGTELASVPVADGAFGAMLAASTGEQLLPIVERDGAGNATAVTGAMWMNADGSSLVVDLDPATGLPRKAVLGDFILLFANWTADGTTADVARIFGPTGFIEVLRGLKLREADVPVPGRLVSRATCLPDCPSKERTQAEMLKVAGLGLSVVSCGMATAVSWGATLLPCTGAVVSAAKMATGQESWLNAPLQRAGKLLGGIDILQCLGGDLSGCLSAAIDRAGSEREKAATREEAYQALVQAADDRLMNGEIPSGYREGDAPECLEFYACTPGMTLQCAGGGTKTCRGDCSWGECPGQGGGSVCTSATDGEAACEAYVRQVEAQCAASGGRIIGWSPDKAACIDAFDCWSNGCPCLLGCSVQCGTDSTCLQKCFASSGANPQAEAAACRSCATPGVNGQCQTGG